MDKLERQAFQTSRALEFFSEKELSLQIGHDKSRWPLAMVKELIDNSLDGCESAGVLPEIEVFLTDDFIFIGDNGPGLPSRVLEKSLDYMVRVSDKNHYVSPSRGQLGNALKCVWAVPFVLDGEHGRVVVSTGSDVHSIDVSMDRIAQVPVIEHTIEKDGFVRNGTFVKMFLPEQARLELSRGEDVFYKMVSEYALFNPHGDFIAEAHVFYRTSTDCPKWSPSTPTSAFWYTPETLRNLIAAMVSNGDKKSLRAFVGEFRGLAGSQKQKQVVDALELSRATLDDLVEDGDIPIETVTCLLNAMQDYSKPVKPKVLGVIGEGHVKKWMIDHHVDETSFRYKAVYGEVQGLPFTLETAFGVYSDDYEMDVITGLNFAPTLSNPFYNLNWFLQSAEVGDYDPVRLVIHLTSPILNFTDRGKSKVSLPNIIEYALRDSITFVCKNFTKAKRKSARGERIRQNQLEKLCREEKPKKTTVKDAAYQVMEEAYRKTSGPRNLPVNVRQLYYAARPRILELTGKEKFDYGYFSQTLIQDYLDENQDKTENWDIVYDARGKFIEPHTGERVDLGTIEVRRYTRVWGSYLNRKVNIPLPSMSVPTNGPVNRFAFALYIEKEGFDEILKAGNIASKYDMAVMSCKGLSVTASRQLVHDLSSKGVTIFVLHDFDKAGFSIVHTLKNSTKRWTYEDKPNVIDIGLRLTDVEEMSLESETVSYGKNDKDPRINIQESGATQEEAMFLVSGGAPGHWHGKRVELNAMTSEQFLEFLERKFEEHGVHKVVPDRKTLESVFVHACRIRELSSRMETVVDEINEMEVTPPETLLQDVQEKLKNNSFMPWDSAVAGMAEHRHTPWITNGNK